MLARAVIDTDVLVAAVCGPPASDAAELLDRHRAGDFEIVSSPLLISELDGVLRRPAFGRLFNSFRIDDLMRTLVPTLLLTEDIYDPPRATPTRTGDLLVAIARAANARFVVTGDEGLATSFVRDVLFVRPGEFDAALDVLAA